MSEERNAPLLTSPLLRRPARPGGRDLSASREDIASACVPPPWEGGAAEQGGGQEGGATPRSLSATKALLRDLVDYAGLFPPAGLSMAEAVANYAKYRQSNESWMLGRFVVPAKRLGEFVAAVDGLAEKDRVGKWGLSVLLGSDVAEDLAREEALLAAPQDVEVVIECYEVPADSVERIEALRGLIPERREVFVELLLGGDLGELTASLARVGFSAKMRTGGVVAESFPSPDAVLRFLEACQRAGIAWKATAGLHHPVRREAPLTYEAGCASATMFGYLNVFLAAVALWLGQSRERALALLGRTSTAGLVFGDESVVWDGDEFSVAEIAATRVHFARSIGSCSFVEPVEEVRALGALFG